MFALVQLRRRVSISTAALAVGMALFMAACGSSAGKSTAPGAADHPATMFKTAKAPGLGTVLTDARGRTVYLLTSGGHTNVPCGDSNGCTKLWPPLPLPAGTPAATAGPGVQASLLGTMRLSDGQMYPTYGGWLLYEFAGDSGSGQARGQGIVSFGGTWYAISPSGDPVTSPVSTPTTSGNGYGY
jgi:predicted lipoprotein with Yx(FWY)xxD motif